MPMVSMTSKKYIKIYQTALEYLEQEMKGKELDAEYIYELDGSYATDDGPAFIAVALIDDTHAALYAPEYLTEEQLAVFEIFLRTADSNDHFLVFSQRDYDAVQKYLYGKKVDVKILT